MDTTKPSIEQDENVVKGDTASLKPTASNPTPVEWAQHFTSQDEAWHKNMDKTLLKRVDRRLMPTLVVMYLLNFLDRSNLAQARQGTLERDLGMTGTDFNLATSIFFVGYLLMQLPSNLLLTRVKPSFYLAASCCLWGVVSTCNAAADNFTHLIVIRFFLGFVEAPFFPGAVFLMSSWYTRAELTRRIAYLYAGNALANMFGGLLGAGILSGLEGDLGIAGWRWLFIIEGVVAIAFALVAMWILPDYPHTTKWLTNEERAYAAWRLIEDIQEADTYGEQGIMDGVKMAVRDYRLYIFVLMQHVSLISQTFQYFFPTIVGTLGYGKITSYGSLLPRGTKDRSLHIVCLTLLSAVGNAIATGSTNVGARYFAMFLMPMGAISAYQIIVSWVANSFPRPLVKRSACIAIANMIGNTATIYGSYLYPSSTGPQYIPGGSANTAICVLVAVLALVLRYLHKWENKKLERAELDAAVLAESGEKLPVDLKQEKRAAGFRYIY
ncbi:putative transporter [Colletotrichum spaethianum]|uniref:Transporter n=1 Tax=Colletotrichum spaethianum TaxID=700344 RepID=A0AA37PAG2_9PEZI|nr:putative transporter [Colletotrichum spaethianum]GKT48628.1 putative transporter [Colletotrichum spaethianum]